MIRQDKRLLSPSSNNCNGGNFAELSLLAKVMGDGPVERQ